MKRHMLLHTDQRPYKCQLCVFATTRYDKLKAHIRKQHGVGEAPTKKRRITDYQLQNQGQTLVLEEDIENSTTTLTIPVDASVGAVPLEIGEEAAEDGAQIIATSDGVPIIAHVQYANLIQYVAT